LGDVAYPSRIPGLGRVSAYGKEAYRAENCQDSDNYDKFYEGESLELPGCGGFFGLGHMGHEKVRTGT
jgi:hypothetical protein